MDIPNNPESVSQEHIVDSIGCYRSKSEPFARTTAILKAYLEMEGK